MDNYANCDIDILTRDKLISLCKSVVYENKQLMGMLSGNKETLDNELNRKKKVYYYVDKLTSTDNFRVVSRINKNPEEQYFQIYYKNKKIPFYIENYGGINLCCYLTIDNKHNMNSNGWTGVEDIISENFKKYSLNKNCRSDSINSL